MFLGSTFRQAHGAGIRYSLVDYGAHAELPRHCHAAAYLSFVVRGAYEERVSALRFDCDRHTVRLHPPGEEHTNRFGPSGGTVLNVELESGMLGENAGLWSDPVMLRGSYPPALWLAWHLTAGGLGPEEAEEQVWSLLSRCRGALRQESGFASHRALDRARDFIEAHLADALPLGVIAAAAELHPTHLARLFARRIGSTVGAYVRQRRVNLAAYLMLNTSDPLTIIASRSGFADHAHLTRTFRAQTGMPPVEFRGQVARRHRR